MKRLLTFCCALIILCATAFAHSGGTDGQGGHNSSSGYHFHHGYPAHDHYDMDGDGDIDCPYEFKDNTKPSSNSSNSNKGSSNKNGQNQTNKADENHTTSTIKIRKSLIEKFFERLFPNDNNSVFVGLLKLVIFIVLYFAMIMGGIYVIYGIVMFIKWIIKKIKH